LKYMSKSVGKRASWFIYNCRNYLCQIKNAVSYVSICSLPYQHHYKYSDLSSVLYWKLFPN
jgi:hypothetical protein